MQGHAFRRSEPFPMRSGSQIRDTALADVQTPPAIRSVAVGVAALFFLLTFVLLLTPWQQSALGTGRVIAYAPADRQQVVQAPVKGRVAEWFVMEGDKVEAGAPLVQIVDNDPELVGRMQSQRANLDDEISALDQQIASYTSKTQLLTAGVDVVVAELDSKIAQKTRMQVGERAQVNTARANESRIRALAADGISSTREAEVALLKLQEAEAKLSARGSEIRAAEHQRSKARVEAQAKLASAQAELESAKQKRAEVERKRSELDSKLARQRAQMITAPRAGTVLRLHGQPGGAQVKEGDNLVTLVPSTESRAVEVWIDGNDMPFVDVGGHVRLAFEGWPALQFVGLPGTSQGTFAGQVGFIDATDDSGKFRVVVVPEDESWPAPDVLRQGVRAKGWLLLGRVSLGYELWRQLNGFPAVPTVRKGDSVAIPSAKKPRASALLK